MGAVIEFVVKELGGKGIAIVEGESGPIGWAVLATQGLYAISDQYQEGVRDKARESIGCVHLEVCRGWAPPSILTIEYAHAKRSCAFLVNGVPLYHPTQANLDVGKLSAVPMRFNKETGKVGNYYMHVEPCRSCSA
jgi:hypothetical protein